MRRLLGRRAAAGVCLGLAMPLAGCGSDAAAPAASLAPLTGTAAPSPTPDVMTTLPSGSGTRGLTAPEPDPLISQPTAAGAEAAVRHYFAALDYATLSGDVQPLLAQSTGDCRSCQYQAEEISKVYDGGGSFQGGQSRVLQVTAQVFDPSTTTLVFVAVARKAMLQTGTMPREYPSVPEANLIFAIVWEGIWSVDGYEPLRSEEPGS